MKISHLMITGLLAASCNAVYAAEHEVKMLNSGKDGTMVFEPGFLKVAAGDTVKFVSTDAGHNASSSITPEGGTTWKGAIGEEISVKMDKDGVYVYTCDPHVVMAMIGVIQVGEATNLDDVKKSSKDLSAKFVMNKDRLENYLAQVK